MAERTAGTAIGDTTAGSEIIYVSWGGTGRAATLRQAIARAAARDAGLVYLAILDDGAFGDIERSMLELAKDELAWLLDAQLELTRQQTGDDVAVRVLVRAGDVADRIVEVADAVGETEVLIGAPVPASADNTVDRLVDEVAERIGAEVRVIEP